MGLFSSTKAPKGQKKKHHRYSLVGPRASLAVREWQLLLENKVIF